jgi:rSAM/selenodomain-associated transferase 1
MSDVEGVDDVIIVFAKAALPGRVKTRLSPALIPEQAAALYRAFVEDIALTLTQLADESPRPLRRVLAFSGPDDDEICSSMRAKGFDVIEQGEGDLGARLRRVCAACFAEGAQRLVIVGTDSPTLHVEYLELAFELLGQKDVVWGPSFDGGYYLVGLRSGGSAQGAPHEHIFEGIEWSTERVLSQSWRRAEAASLLCDLLGFWYDVDTIEDVEALKFHLLHYLAKQQPDLAPNTAAFLRKMEAVGDLNGTQK